MSMPHDSGGARILANFLLAWEGRSRQDAIRTVWLQDVLPSVTDAEPDEAVPVGWAFLHFLSPLRYYILRPVRDEMAIEGGVQYLPLMMTATLPLLYV